MTVGTTPIIKEIENLHEYYVAASGGDVTVERRLEDDSTWVPVFNSPVVDGQEALMRTKSFDNEIRLTATAEGTFFELNRVRG